MQQWNSPPGTPVDMYKRGEMWLPAIQRRSGELQPRGAIVMRSAIGHCPDPCNLLICKYLFGSAIATEELPVAIPKQYRCKPGYPPCGVARA